MEGDIDISHITTYVRKVHPVALLCPRLANKHTFESMRGEFREGRKAILEKSSTPKNPRRKREEGQGR